MQRKRWWFVGSLCGLVALAMVGCGQSGNKRIILLTNGADPFWDAMRAGMQAAWLNRDAKDWPAQYAPPERTISTLDEII